MLHGTQKSSTQGPTKFRSNTTSGSCYQQVRNTRRSFSRRWCFWHCSSSCSTLVCVSTEKAHRIERSINFVCHPHMYAGVVWGRNSNIVKHSNWATQNMAIARCCRQRKTFMFCHFFAGLRSNMTWICTERIKTETSESFSYLPAARIQISSRNLIVRCTSAFVRSRRLGNKKTNVMMMIRVSLYQI